MATKSANVMARVEPDIKEKAEAIMSQLGIPVSVVINMLYRQIIMKNGIPFSTSVSSGMLVRDQLSAEQFDMMMERDLAQAKADDSFPADQVFAELKREIGQ